ncbi:MAG TPA: dephospho-CoA kinase [Gammaproteobacteria bacterium]|jgi:dephospho-CoA kinase
MVVALTGGIGSGKTTVSGMFGALGVPVVDADEISRNATRSGGAAFGRVVDLFGPSVVGSDGELRRDLIRGFVFDDRALRMRLEAIIHPLVYSEIRERIAASDAPYCIVSVPLLLESGDAEEFDRVLVVDAPEAVRMKRVMERDGLAAGEVHKIIDSQTRRDERLRAADDVIRNDGDLAHLQEQVERLHREYVRLTEDRVAGHS